MSVQTLIKRNTGMTSLGEVAGQVERMSENNWDELVKVKEIQLPDIDHMVIGEAESIISEVIKDLETGRHRSRRFRPVGCYLGFGFRIT